MLYIVLKLLSFIFFILCIFRVLENYNPIVMRAYLKLHVVAATETFEVLGLFLALNQVKDMLLCQIFNLELLSFSFWLSSYLARVDWAIQVWHFSNCVGYLRGVRRFRSLASQRSLNVSSLILLSYLYEIEAFKRFDEGVVACLDIKEFCFYFFVIEACTKTWDKDLSVFEYLEIHITLFTVVFNGFWFHINDTILRRLLP